MHTALFDFLIFTAAASLFVPIFKYFKIGAILAYLFSGIIIGPHILGFIKDPKEILHFSELGVVFLLFIIGLELAPKRLWKLRRNIFGLGLLQVLCTGFLFMYLAKCFGLNNAAAYVTGFGLALSSTAFSIQILEEKHQLKTFHGQGSFSILMFQDLAVVPLIASLALFTENPIHSPTLTEITKIVGIVLGVVLAGRYGLRYILRLVADSRTPEVFTAISLFIVLGTAILIESIGLSMGMGAFLAGVILANSEYRHELESNLQPFKGLLLGLFFIAVGMSLDLNILVSQPHWILLITLAFMALKSGLLFALARLFGYPRTSAQNIAFTLPQGGEFAFVLFATALGKGFLDTETSSILSASVTLSMALTPFFFELNQRYTPKSKESREFDKIENEDPVIIIAGYGRFGQIVSRFLNSQKIHHTILEHSAAQVDTAREFGNKVYYGDAARSDILEAAGAKSAKYFVLAIDDPANSVRTAKMVREDFPELKVFARARNRQHAIDLMEVGVKIVHRETLLTSLEIAKEVLLEMNVPREKINTRLAKFTKKDNEILKTQFDLRHDQKEMINYTTKANLELEKILSLEKDGS